MLLKSTIGGVKAVTRILKSKVVCLNFKAYGALNFE